MNLLLLAIPFVAATLQPKQAASTGQVGAGKGKAADSQPATATLSEPAPPKPLDLADEHCTGFRGNYAEINKLDDQCGKIGRGCSDRLPYRELSQKCLSKLTFLYELTADQLKEVIDGGVHHLPIDRQFVKAIVERVDWTTAPPYFIIDFLKSKELADLFFHEFGKDAAKMTMFINETSAPLLPLEACRMIGTKEIMQALSNTVFKEIGGLCFGEIQPPAFEGIRWEQLANTNNDALEHMTNAQAASIAEQSIAKGITKTVAEHLGPLPNIPRNWLLNQKARHAYVHGHACKSALNWQKPMEKPAWDVLSKRCAPIWKFLIESKNDAASIAASNNHVLLLTTALLVLVL